MELSTRTAAEVASITVQQLGLDEEFIDIAYPEALYASLRRAASFLCPTTPRALVDAVRDALAPIMQAPLERDHLMTAIEQLVSSGDLLELAHVGDERRTRLLFLGPPSYVEKEPGRYLLVGIRPLGTPLVGPDTAVDYEAHTRTVTVDPAEVSVRLRGAGLHEINVSRWIAQPSTLSATEFLATYQQRLDVAREAGAVEGLQIIDSSAKPTYYRGRWRPPALGDTGDYVGRRPQAYGADRWCLIRLENGAPANLVDLPVGEVVTPARDEAWRLQAAIDALRQVPQTYGVGLAAGIEPAAVVVDFFSPLPGWADRYLGLVGLAIEKSRGALFSYRVPKAVLPKLNAMLADTLWMGIATDRGQE